MTRVSIVRTGVANLASVQAAFHRLGAEVELADTPEDVERAQHLVLPGVGAFAAGVEALTARDLVEPLRAHVHADKPLLAVCLGLQLLCDASEEAPGVPGLSICDGEVTRFSDAVRVPQLGWNDVEPRDGCALPSGSVYFANSYCLRRPPDGCTWLACDYDGTFVAAFTRGNLLACQFHPELSGAYGRDLLRAWLEVV